MSGLNRVLLYSHDTYGLGHLRRNLAIATHLLGTVPGIQVVLATGSVVADQFTKPEGLQVVELPPVIKTGVEKYNSREPGMSLSLVRRARSAVLIDVVKRWKPDVLLVDHSPQGMKGELLPVFDALAEHSPRTKVVLGLRDIIDDPASVREVWEAEGVYETLETVYDKILVYGQREIADVVSAYGLSASVASRLSYCGYVVSPGPSAPKVPDGVGEGQSYVLGTVGGGGDGVEILLATLEAASDLGLAPVLACGPLMPPKDRQLIEERAKQYPGALLVDMFDDVAAVAMGASCVVTRGGYNSLCELVPLGVPVVVVPRSWPRTEQLLRARAFESRGLVTAVESSDEPLDASLRRTMQTAMAVAGADLDALTRLNMDGLARMGNALVDLTAADSVRGAGLGDLATMEGMDLAGAPL